MPSSKTDANINGFYDDESCYYTFNRSHPVFISSKADFPDHFNSSRNNEISPHDPIIGNTQWLWNTSLQSLSNLNCKRSISNQSKLSTRAIRDDSPPRNSSILNKTEHKVKRYHHSKPHEADHPSDSRHNYTTSDTLPDDSGVHSMSVSHSRVISDVYAKPKRTASHHRYRSLELDPRSDVSGMHYDGPPAIPKHASTQSPYPGLTRSFSTRLSATNATLHRSKLNSQDNHRHVMFQEQCGTMY